MFGKSPGRVIDRLSLIIIMTRKIDEKSIIVDFAFFRSISKLPK